MTKIKDSFFGGAEKKAGKASREGFQASSAAFSQAGQDIQNLFAPQVGFGASALEQQAGLAGARGPQEEARALQAFQESPGQKFLRERQERALIRNSAAIGGLGGGNVRTALQEQAAGIAAQQQQQRFANLGAITNVGQAGLTQQAQGIQFGAGGVAQGLVGAGQAKSGAILGQAEGFRRGVGMVAQGAGAAAGGPAGAAAAGGGFSPSSTGTSTSAAFI